MPSKKKKTKKRGGGVGVSNASLSRRSKSFASKLRKRNELEKRLKTAQRELSSTRKKELKKLTKKKKR